jgi:hypothetical protein
VGEKFEGSSSRYSGVVRLARGGVSVLVAETLGAAGVKLTTGGSDGRSPTSVTPGVQPSTNSEKVVTECLK